MSSFDYYGQEKMSSLAENLHASKELEQARTSYDQLEVCCQVSNKYINQKYAYK